MLDRATTIRHLPSSLLLLSDSRCRRVHPPVRRMRARVFSDYIIGTIAREAGCEWVYTFDAGLKTASGFKLLG